MEKTRPLTDLRDKFEEVCDAVHQTAEPILLTKEGQGDMVLMSLDAYEKMEYDWKVLAKLMVGEKEMKLTDKRYSVEKVLGSLLGAAGEARVV